MREGGRKLGSEEGKDASCRADAPSSTDLMTEIANGDQVPLPSRERMGAGAIHGSSPTTDPAFQPRSITISTKLTDLLYLTQDEFSAAFKGSAVTRAKRRGLLRNAAVALAGRNDAEAIAALEHALDDSEELVREAAKWALAHINVGKL